METSLYIKIISASVSNTFIIYYQPISIMKPTHEAYALAKM